MLHRFALLLALALPGAALHAQSCVSACPSAGGSTAFEWIKTVSIGPLFNNSGNNGGYADFGSTFPATFNAGSSYSFTVAPGYGDGPFSETWRAWMDLNQDGDFDDAGELIFSAFGQYAQSGSFSIPATALNGLTRLRVAMSFAVPPACGGFAEGEVEDYCVTITGGVTPTCDASAPVSGLNATVAAGQVSLSWTPVTASVACRVSGGIVPAFNRNKAVVGTGVSGLDIPVSLLAPGTYQWKVACACALGPLDVTPDSAVDTFVVPALRTGETPLEATPPTATLAPNPTRGPLALTLQEPVDAWRIVDLLGRTLRRAEGPLPTGTLHLDAGDLAPGAYRLVLERAGAPAGALPFVVE